MFNNNKLKIKKDQSLPNSFVFLKRAEVLSNVVHHQIIKLKLYPNFIGNIPISEILFFAKRCEPHDSKW